MSHPKTFPLRADEEHHPTLIWHVSDPYPRGGGVINGVGPGGQVMVPAVDEVPPPPYQSVAGGAPMVSCRVCQVSREKLPTNLQSMMNAKLSKHGFWHCHENGLIKTIQTIPHNL